MNNESNKNPSESEKTHLFSMTRITTIALTLGGMVVGAIVGIGVQVGVESTGLLGPTVDALIAEQEANFSDVNSRLDELRKASTDPETRRQLTELANLLRRQDELSSQANSELQYLDEQVATLKDQQLAESGQAGGANFWLKAGESVSVAGRDQVFALMSARRNIADINLSGTRKRMVVGDTLPVVSGERACSIFFKQAIPRADGRIGFDLTCS